MTKLHPNSNIAIDYAIGQEWGSTDNPDRRTISDLLVTYVDFIQSTQPTAIDGVCWLNTSNNRYYVYVAGAGSVGGWRDYDVTGLTLHGRGALFGNHYVKTANGYTDLNALASQVTTLNNKAARLLDTKPNFVGYGRIGSTIGINQNLLNFGTVGGTGELLYTPFTAQYNYTFSIINNNKVVFNIGGLYSIKFICWAGVNGAIRDIWTAIILNGLVSGISFDSKTTTGASHLKHTCEAFLNIPVGAQLEIYKTNDTDVWQTIHKEYWLYITYIGDKA